MKEFTAFNRKFKVGISKENQLFVMFNEKDSDILAYDLKYVIENFRTFNLAIRQMCINLIEAEDLWEVDDGYESNAHCDTYGVCGGYSCSYYFECQGK